jgi:hypothetical protein
MELSAVSQEKLNRKAQEASVLRSWCQHDGYKLFKEKFEKKINRAREMWLSEDSEKKCRELKRDAQVWQAVIDELKQTMIEGDQALRVLQSSNLEDSAK